MSQSARTLLYRKLSNNPNLTMDEAKRALVDERDIQPDTAEIYVKKYCDMHWDNDENAYVIIGADEEFEEELIEAQMGFSEDDDETLHEDVEVASLEQECPDPSEESWESGEAEAVVYQPGHPLVPPELPYMKRRLEADADDGRQDTTDVEAYIRALQSEDYGVCLIGEPGTGKGRLTKYAAAKRNKPYIRVNFGSRITKEKLVGGFVPKGAERGDMEEKLDEARELVEDEDDVRVAEALEILNVRDKFEWQDGLLTKAVRYGWDFVADEINGAPAEALLPLHGLLEDKESRTLELTEKGEVVKPHDDFNFVATMNPPHHPGTKELGDALKGRLIPLRVNYLSEDREASLMKMKTDNLSDAEVEKLVNLAGDIRSAYPEDLRVPCTPRELDKIAHMSTVVGLEGACHQILLGMATDKGDRDALEKRIGMQF